ncbi:MAG: diguanylate cyclase [Deltaproteobacteria bacterium]|jgi:diguanylate cyclase (GGDEF)-like protein|nr:diguanylate cyclase [Deltaproteobacteria bacterium]
MSVVKVLVMGNYGPDFNRVARALRPFGLGLMWTESLKDGLGLLPRARPALLIVGDDLPGLKNPADILNVIEAERLPTQVVVVAKDPDFDRSMDMVADGVFSVVSSPVDVPRLRRVAGRVLANHSLYETLVDRGAADHNPGSLFIYKSLAGHMEVRPLMEAICSTARQTTGASRVEAWRREDDEPGHQTVFSSGPVRDKSEFDLTLELAWLEGPLATVSLSFESAGNRDSLDPKTLDELTFACSLFLSQALRFEEAINMASRDPLTGMCNRRVFLETINREYCQARRHQSSLSLLTLDLDHFKNVNDTYGHQTGDEILKWLAGVVQSVVRSGDLAARTGGEEFSIVMPRTNLEQARNLALRLRQALALTPLPPGLQAVRPTISQGLAGIEHFLVNSPQDLIYLSDQAMYLAKREGRDTIRQAADLPGNTKFQDVQYVFQ